MKFILFKRVWNLKPILFMLWVFLGSGLIVGLFANPTIPQAVFIAVWLIVHIIMMHDK